MTINSGFSHIKWWIFPVRYVTNYQRDSRGNSELNGSVMQLLPGGRCTTSRWQLWTASWGRLLRMAPFSMGFDSKGFFRWELPFTYLVSSRIGCWSWRWRWRWRWWGWRWWGWWGWGGWGGWWSQTEAVFSDRGSYTLGPCLRTPPSQWKQPWWLKCMAFRSVSLSPPHSDCQAAR